jgi:hypothetical protein
VYFTIAKSGSECSHHKEIRIGADGYANYPDLIITYYIHVSNHHTVFYECVW